MTNNTKHRIAQLALAATTIAAGIGLVASATTAAPDTTGPVSARAASSFYCVDLGWTTGRVTTTSTHPDHATAQAEYDHYTTGAGVGSSVIPDAKPYRC